MFVVITVALFVISFLLALRSLKKEMERYDKKEMHHAVRELEHGKSIFISRD